MAKLGEPRVAAVVMIATVAALIYLGLTALGAQLSVPPGTGDPVLGQWVSKSGSTITLRVDGAIDGDRTGTWIFTGTVDGARNYELHWQHKGWVDYMFLSADCDHFDGKTRRGKSVSYVRGAIEATEQPSPTPNPSPPAAAAEEGSSNAELSAPPASRRPGNPPPEVTNPRNVYEHVQFRTDDAGHPIAQVIRLNEKVIADPGGYRYSGFWFILDRAEVAQKQGGIDPSDMSLYWYFVRPKAMTGWGIFSVNDSNRDHNLVEGLTCSKLKLWRFPQLRHVPPKDKDCFIVQECKAKHLREGQAYYVDFELMPGYTDPVDVTFSLGFRKTIGDFHRWNGIDKALDFLGLAHKGKVNGADHFKD